MNAGFYLVTGAQPRAVVCAGSSRSDRRTAWARCAIGARLVEQTATDRVRCGAEVSLRLEADAAAGESQTHWIFQGREAEPLSIDP